MTILSPFNHLDPLPFLLRSEEDHDHSEDDDSCSGGCITRWKIAFAVLLLLEGLVFGHVVFLVKRFSSSKAFHAALHIGNAVSAGIFFATGMLHIIPEATELLSSGEDSHDIHHDIHHVEREEEEEHHEEEGHEVEFPWAFLVIMLSFYLVFFVEQILVPFLARRRSSHLEQQDVESNSGDVEKKLDTDNPEASTEVGRGAAGFGSPDFVKGLIEILGLSAHSLFESMALGLSSEFGTVLNIFIATAAHRWATALALAFKLSRSLRYLPFLVLLFLFSIMVPLGIGIGAALSELSARAQGVLFAISAGTFIYIGVFESMADEFVLHKKWPFTKFAATLIGASIIVVTTVLLVRFDVHG